MMPYTFAPTTRTSRTGLAVIAILCAAVVLISTGCNSAPVVTSTGATVSGNVVAAENTFGDFLHGLRTNQVQAVAVYEATKGSMDSATRESQYRTLTNMANGIDASQALLIAAKQAGAGADTVTVLRPLLTAAPAFLALAVATHVLTQAQADIVSKVLGTVPLAEWPVSAVTMRRLA